MAGLTANNPTAPHNRNRPLVTQHLAKRLP